MTGVWRKKKRAGVLLCEKEENALAKPVNGAACPRTPRKRRNAYGELLRGHYEKGLAGPKTKTRLGKEQLFRFHREDAGNWDVTGVGSIKNDFRSRESRKNSRLNTPDDASLLKRLENKVLIS